MTVSLEEMRQRHESPELAAQRKHEIVAELMERHPNSRELLNELTDLIGTLCIQAEEEAVIHHGKQILAVIEGHGYTGPGNMDNYDVG